MNYYYKITIEKSDIAAGTEETHYVEIGTSREVDEIEAIVDLIKSYRPEEKKKDASKEEARP